MGKVGGAYTELAKFKLRAQPLIPPSLLKTLTPTASSGSSPKPASGLICQRTPRTQEGRSGTPTVITGEASKWNPPKWEMRTMGSGRHPNTELQSSSPQEPWMVSPLWSQRVTTSTRYCQPGKPIGPRCPSRALMEASSHRPWLARALELWHLPPPPPKHMAAFSGPASRERPLSMWSWGLRTNQYPCRIALSSRQSPNLSGA